MTRNGVPFMKSVEKKKALRHILSIPGSGHTKNVSKKQELLHCSEADLIRE